MRDRDRLMSRLATSLIISGISCFVSVAQAHDPVFGPGPHTLFKGGIEFAVRADIADGGDSRDHELAAELAYGLTGDWSIGLELPYAKVEESGLEDSGMGDLSVFTKFRFWRHDKLATQSSAAVLLKILSKSGDEQASPPLGTGSTDTILGLTYGYEGRTWYRWASVRYRYNGESATGMRRGQTVLIDLAGGWRPRRRAYREPDAVWLLEFNGIRSGKAQLDGADLAGTGGTQWFLSPGLFWTYRNFAIKAGIQIPFYDDLDSPRSGLDYRANLTFEWHL